MLDKTFDDLAGQALRTLQQIFVEPERYEALSANSLARVRDFHDAEKVGRMLDDIYSTALQPATIGDPADCKPLVGSPDTEGAPSSYKTAMDRCVGHSADASCAYHPHKIGYVADVPIKCHLYHRLRTMRHLESQQESGRK